jgi:hypothetical protein
MGSVLNRYDIFSGRVGYPAATLLAVYWSVVALIVRLAFGEHSFVQAGTEALVFADVIIGSYCFGYYAERLFISRQTLHTLVGEFSLISSTRVWFFSILAAVLTVVAGRCVHSVIDSAFTSNFFLAVYALTAAWMVRIGLSDRKVQNWNDAGIA